MNGLILFLTARILTYLIYPIGFTYSILLTLFKSGYKELDNYLFDCALAEDQRANTYLSKLFNDFLIKVGGHRFGNPDETISSVLGKNQLTGTLSMLGRALNWVLNKIEEDHSIKSIEK
jgi:hypothetical protein